MLLSSRGTFYILIKEDSRCLSSLAMRAATPVAAPFGRFSAGSAAASVADMIVLAQPFGWAVSFWR